MANGRGCLCSGMCTTPLSEAAQGRRRRREWGEGGEGGKGGKGGSNAESVFCVSRST